MPMRKSTWRRGDSSRIRLNRHGSRPAAHIDSMTKSILTTDWSLASWNGVGTTDWRRFTRWKSNLLNTTQDPITIGLKDRERLLTLGRDLSRAWDSASASVETRKKIVRLLIAEIVIDVAG